MDYSLHDCELSDECEPLFPVDSLISTADRDRFCKYNGSLDDSEDASKIATGFHLVYWKNNL